MYRWPEMLLSVMKSFFKNSSIASKHCSAFKIILELIPVIPLLSWTVLKDSTNQQRTERCILEGISRKIDSQSTAKTKQNEDR